MEPEPADPVVPSTPSTSLRDAIAAARVTPADLPQPARFDVPDLERRGLPWLMLQRKTHSFDPNFPKHDIP